MNETNLPHVEKLDNGSTCRKKHQENVKKHLTEFLWLKKLALKFGMADFELKLFRLQRSSNEKPENYSVSF